MSGEIASYDLIAIGSGPAGRAAAVEAAALGARVAVVERDRALGGSAASVAALAPRLLRAAAVELAGLYGEGRRPHERLELDTILWRAEDAARAERDAVQDELRRLGVDVIAGTASFADEELLEVSGRRLRGDRFVIATGSVPALRPGTAHDAAQLLRLRALPDEIVVLGGGIAGLELASAAVALRTRVTLIEQRDVLAHVDEEIAESLRYHLRGRGLVIRSGRAEPPPGAVVIGSDGRGATERLNLARAGLRADERGCIPVDRRQRTELVHVFAAGDVAAGATAPAATQGRMAALAALGVQPGPADVLVPHVIATVPEVAFAGPDEQSLASNGIAYVCGVAHHRELAPAAVGGDTTGMLKLLVERSSHRVLAVHAIGTGASESAHLGLIAMLAGLSVDVLADVAFDPSTPTSACGLAAIDAVERLQAEADPASAISPMRFVRPDRTFAP